MKLYYQILLILLVAGPQAIGQRQQHSQFWQEQPGTWRVSLETGPTRYAGDMSEEKDLLKRPRLGGLAGGSVSYRFTPWLTARADGRIYFIHGNQQDTRIWYNGLSFLSLNPDAALTLQADLWPVDDPTHVLIPYVFLGGGLTYLNTVAAYRGQLVSLPPIRTEGVAYSRLPGILRWGFGMPVKTAYRTLFSLEFSYTHVLNDYLDDVSTRYPDFSQLSPFAAGLSDRRGDLGIPLPPNQPGDQRGNPTARDGYFAFTLRYTHLWITTARQKYGRSRQAPRFR